MWDHPGENVQISNIAVIVGALFPLATIPRNIFKLMLIQEYEIPCILNGNDGHQNEIRVILPVMLEAS